MTLNPQILRPGQARHERSTLPRRPGRPAESRVQYDYRHTDGELFSCVARNMNEARQKRDEWLRRPMTDGEYADIRESERDICPCCRSSRVSSQGDLSWDSAAILATSPLKCDDCGAEWDEILRPVGYELNEGKSS